LIGRLLCDCDGAFEDQLAAVSRASIAKGTALDLSLLTDGLRAEREQGITIDVAYRYFATARRKFIIADAPGHEQYTRNMVTGASHSDLLVLLVDSRKGILSQTCRHLYVAWLLGIRQVILAVNKMDLVYFEQRAFQKIQDAFSRLGNSLTDLNFWVVPVSARDGDNIAARSERMPWYHGPSLLELLESIPVQTAHHESPLRFPIQLVVRPNQDFRGYAGQIASGVMKPRQEVIVLPSGQRATIEQVLLHSNTVEETFYPMSVMVCLKEHLDIGRGDMLADVHNPPSVTKRFQARLIWMSANPLRTNEKYLLKHSSQVVCASVTSLMRKVDVNTLETIAADALEFNDIGEVEIETHKPLFCDPYVQNRLTGSFILIDPTENSTIAAGTIQLVIDEAGISNNGAGRRATAGSSAFHSGLTVWFTGLSGPYKTAICHAVLTELLVRGIQAELLDDKAFREFLDRGPGSDNASADMDIRKIGFVARLVARHGVLVLVSANSQPGSGLEELRLKTGNFMNVHVNTSPQTCEPRVHQGSYSNGRNGEPYPFTKMDRSGEKPLLPDIECYAAENTVKESVEKVLAAVLQAPGFNEQ
jgi:bifunctional enzyme CysN/CysC